MIIDTDNPICPDCGTVLEASSFWKVVGLDALGSLIVSAIGQCGSCGACCEWDEHYAYKGFVNLEKRLDK